MGAQKFLKGVKDDVEFSAPSTIRCLFKHLRTRNRTGSRIRGWSKEAQEHPAP